MMRTWKCNRFNLYMKHHFLNNQLLENFAQNEDTTIVSLDLEAKEAARLTMKKIAADWNQLQKIMQRAWQVWAKQLNDCPPVGVVSQRPRLLLIRMSNQQLLLNDIEHNWSRFRRSMNSGVRSARRTRESNRVSCVSIEKVKRSH